MKIEMFRDIIAQRINVEEISHGEWTEGEKRKEDEFWKAIKNDSNVLK